MRLFYTNIVFYKELTYICFQWKTILHAHDNIRFLQFFWQKSSCPR